MAGMTAAFCCSVANAQIVYSNSFNVTGLLGNQNISGTAPDNVSDFAGGSSSAVWLDAAGTNAVGQMARNGNVTATGNDSWTLPFTPQSGYIYNLTATLAFTGNTGSWVGIGFANGNPTDLTGNQAQLGVNWLLLQNYNAGVNYFSGGSPSLLAAPANGTYFPAGASTNTVDLVLDTSSSLWTVSVSINGTPVVLNKVGAGTGTTFTYTTNPTIGGIGVFQHTGNTAPQNYHWSDLMLTAQVPEPSTPVLIGLGVAMMLLVTLYRNRRDMAGKSLRQ